MVAFTIHHSDHGRALKPIACNRKLLICMQSEFAFSAFRSVKDHDRTFYGVINYKFR